jgi:putative methyltransferase (TIGR04325 family)
MTLPHVIWSGVYDDFPDYHSKNEKDSIFDIDNWLLKQKDELKKVNENTEYATSGGSFLYEGLQRLDYSLHEPLSLLDVGGGVALEYVRLKKIGYKLNPFILLEVPAIIEWTTKEFERESDIEFYTELNEQMSAYQVLHIGSALQYFETPYNTLRSLIHNQLQSIILSGLLTSIDQEFVSAQHYYDHQQPIWFINLSNLISFLEKLGYTITYQKIRFAKYFGKLSDPPVDSLPPEYQNCKKVDLIFSKV